MDENRARCHACGLEFFAPWRGAAVVCVNPITAAEERAGQLYMVACPGCGEYQIELQGADPTEERSPLYRSQTETTLKVVITLVIEIESYRRAADGGEPFSEAEKQEYREQPDIIQKARRLIAAIATGAASGAGGNIIAGMLGFG